MKKSIAIIGGGASALMLAAMLDEQKFDITLFEKNATLGRKFLVAGDGGLNITHAQDFTLLLNQYTPSSFLELALHTFTNKDFIAWLSSIGIDTYIGTSNRVYPLKNIKPIHVLNAIVDLLVKKGIHIKTKYNWNGYDNFNKLIFNNNNEVIETDFVVYALGGCSWSITGSDGLWLSWFKNRGVSIVPFQASNCAFKVNWEKDFIEKYNGKPLKNIEIICNNINRKGEVVITKFGLEGGAIYSLSVPIRDALLKNKEAVIYIDLKTILSKQDIEIKLTNSIYKNITETLKHSIKLSTTQIALIKAQVSKEVFNDFNLLANNIKNLPISIVALAPLDDAISTVGGIALSEVNENFELKAIPNHYAIGEMLDWDAPTGGYLLQANFSMGYYLAKKLNETE